MGEEVLAEFDLDLELFRDAPATMIDLAGAAAEGDGARATSPTRRCCCSTSPPPRSDRTRWRPCIAPSPRAGVAALAWCRSSHGLPEVLEIADRITVLRDGRNQGTFRREDHERGGARRAHRRPPVRRRPFPPPAPHGGGSLARCSSSTASKGRPWGQSVRARDRRDRGDRRRRGQRSAAALRLSGGPPAAEGRAA